MERLAAPQGGEVGYRVFGNEGPWVALIHGWCGSAGQWDLIAPALSDRRRVVAVSHPGFGGMGAPPATGRTIEAMADAFVLVLDRLGIDRVTLVGHSMGGPIAVEAAIRLAGRARALIGLDTLTDRSYYGRQSPNEIAARRARFEAGFAARIGAMVDDIAHPSTPAETRKEIAEAMASVPSFFALDVKDALFAWDVEERWPRVRCPTMILNSAHVARFADPRPMACFEAAQVRLYDSGHFPMIEHPEMIAAALNECIDSATLAQGASS